MLSVDQLARSRHARIDHAHGEWMPGVEILAHVLGEKGDVFRVGRDVFERLEGVLAFIILFFATVAAVGSFRAIATVMCSAVSVKWH